MPRLLIVEEIPAVRQALISFCEADGIEHLAVSSESFGRGELTREEYVRRHGDDLSFSAAFAHTLHVRQAFGRRKYMDTRAAPYRRLRHFASELDRTIADFRPDAIAIYQGFFPFAQVALSRAIRRGIPPLFVEVPISPGAALIVDPCAPFFLPALNAVDVGWSDATARPLGEPDRARAAAFVDTWRARRQTKISAPAISRDADRLREFLARDDRPVALLALQVRRDMSVVFNVPPKYGQRYEAWVEDVVRSVPSDWKLVVKPHPRDWHEPRVERDNVLVVGGVDIHDAITASTCVITLCSNVGLEAVLWDKPVLVGGRPFYAGKGVTLDLPDEVPAALPALLQRARSFAVDPSRKLALVHRALLDYQLWPGDTGKLARAMAAAPTVREPATRDVRRPFFDRLPPDRRAEIEFLEEYDRIASQGCSHWRALALLTAEPRFAALREVVRPLQVARTTLARRIGVLGRSIRRRLGR